jgi:hypothetical protein
VNDLLMSGLITPIVIQYRALVDLSGLQSGRSCSPRKRKKAYSQASNFYAMTDARRRATSRREQGTAVNASIGANATQEFDANLRAYRAHIS